jgi:hypothetical protein
MGRGNSKVWPSSLADDKCAQVKHTLLADTTVYRPTLILLYSFICNFLRNGFLQSLFLGFGQPPQLCILIAFLEDYPLENCLLLLLLFSHQ